MLVNKINEWVEESVLIDLEHPKRLLHVSSKVSTTSPQLPSSLVSWKIDFIRSWASPKPNSTCASASFASAPSPGHPAMFSHVSVASPLQNVEFYFVVLLCHHHSLELLMSIWIVFILGVYALVYSFFGGQMHLFLLGICQGYIWSHNGYMFSFNRCCLYILHRSHTSYHSHSWWIWIFLVCLAL